MKKKENIPPKLSRLLLMATSTVVLLTLVDIFTSSASAQSTSQDTICSGNTCTTKTCVNGECKTTNSGSGKGNFALNICINGACTGITKP
jgi:hypothetical protein